MVCAPPPQTTGQLGDSRNGKCHSFPETAKSKSHDIILQTVIIIRDEFNCISRLRRFLDALGAFDVASCRLYLTSLASQGSSRHHHVAFKH